MSSIIHPRMFQTLAKFYPSTCSIQQVSEATQDEHGEIQESWTDRSGFTDIECRVSPAGGTERKSPQEIWSVATHVVELTGFYEVVVKNRAVVTFTDGRVGLTLDVLLVTHDGNEESTRLVCELVK